MPFISAVVHAVAHTAAFLVSIRHSLVVHHLTIDDCEHENKAPGSTELAIHARPLGGLSRWRVSAWIGHAVAPEVEHCLNIYLLGWSIEVWYVKKGMQQTSSRPIRYQAGDLEYLVETGWVPTGWKRGSA